MRVGEVSYFAEEAEGLFGDEGLFGLGAGTAFKGRIEVKDAATGNYIPGAAATLHYGPLDHPESVKLGPTNLTDAGGNVLFDLTTADPAEAFWYSISAPGYVSKQMVPAESMTLKTISLDKVGAVGGVPVAALAVGGVAVLGILAFAFFKK
jgi:hypothetical protein